MHAVTTAAGKLHDLATQQLNEDDLPAAPNEMISTMQRYSLATLYRGRERANPSSIHCSIDDDGRSDQGDHQNVIMDYSRGDGKSDEERRNNLSSGHMGYREGPSWGTHLPAPALTVSALETIVERNDDDVEMGRSVMPEALYDHGGSSQLRSVFAHAREQLLQQQQQQLQQQQQQQLQLQQQEEQECQHQILLRQMIQEEIDRSEDKTSLMSEITAGTFRSERHQAQSILNFRLCDTQYI